MKKQATPQEESKEETFGDAVDLQDKVSQEQPKILIEDLA